MKRWAPGVVVFAATLGVFLFGGHASALSGNGPDPADLGGVGGDVFTYIVSDSSNASATIPTTKVNVYYNDNTSAKAITIIGGDLCTDGLESAPGSGNYRDRPNNGDNGTLATYYYLSAYDGTAAIGGSSVAGYTSSSNSCYRATKTITVNNSWLKYDSDTGKYAVSFWASFNSGAIGGSNGQNRFQLRTNAGGIISYVADPSKSSDAFGIARDYPYSGFRDYSLPFAADCSVTAPRSASLYIYDDDNGDAAIQNGRYMTMQLEEYNGATKLGNVPLTFSGGSVTNNGGNNYTLSTGSKRGVNIAFTVKPGLRYRWKISDVYYVNILQFQLPFDSIYYVTGCRAPSYSCGALSASSGEITRTVTGMRMNVIVSGAPPPGPYEMSYTVRSPSGVVSGPFVIGASSTGIASFNFTPPDSGPYQFTWSFIAGAAVLKAGCTGVFTAYRAPYVQVFGGDVQAGAALPPTCVVPVAGYKGIAALNAGSTAGYAGSGTELAAIAYGVVKDFVSAQQRTAAPLKPAGLSFANTSLGTNPFGGGLGDAPCIEDYASLFPASGVPTGLYNVTPGGTPKTVGGAEDIFVQGDAFVSGNIVYAGNGSWSVAAMPSFRLIVKGNIYIKSTVTELHGTYIALPAGGNDGRIYTCSVNGTPPTEAQVINECGSVPLSVYGSFIAQEVKLLRTKGTIAQGAPAEVFYFSPATWIAPAATQRRDGARSDALTTLPPIL